MLDDIHLFVTLVNTSSFKKTAEIFAIQQSTVSKRIARLERDLHETLIERDTRNLALTNFGKSIYARFKHLSESFYTDFSDCVKADYNANEVLNVSLAAALSYELICPHLDKFTELYPHITLNIYFDYGISNLTNIDLAITTQHIDDDKYNQRFLRTEIASLYCTEHYAQHFALPEKIVDLAQHRVIGLLPVQHDVNSPLIHDLRLINKKTKEEILSYNEQAKLRVNSVLHMKKIGQHTNYIFGCWDYMCEADLKNGQLIKVLPDWEIYNLDFYLISRKKVRLIEQTFVNFICECMGYQRINL